MKKLLLNSRFHIFNAVLIISFFLDERSFTEKLITIPIVCISTYLLLISFHSFVSSRRSNVFSILNKVSFIREGKKIEGIIYAIEKDDLLDENIIFIETKDGELFFEKEQLVSKA